MPSINSRQKGKRGEVELAHLLSEYGFRCRRGQQYSGANGDADVVGIPGVHIECKRTNRLKPYDFLAQARRDARDGEMPVVMMRSDRQDWLALMSLDDLMTLLLAWIGGDEDG